MRGVHFGNSRVTWGQKSLFTLSAAMLSPVGTFIFDPFGAIKSHFDPPIVVFHNLTDQYGNLVIGVRSGIISFAFCKVLKIIPHYPKIWTKVTGQK